MTDQGDDTNRRVRVRPRTRSFGKGRMEAFSDGVFAIAITLLVLDLAIPEGSGRDLLSAFFADWPQYLAYVVSFATIGSIWLAHNTITEHLHHVDSTFLRLNLILLLFASFLPFPTRFLAEYIGSDRPERVAVTIYGISLFLLSGLVLLLWRYAISAKLVRPDPDDAEVAVYSQRLTPGLGGYVVLIVIGLFWPVVAVIGYLAVAVFIIVPFKFRSRPERSDAETGTEM